MCGFSETRTIPGLVHFLYMGEHYTTNAFLHRQYRHKGARDREAGQTFFKQTRRMEFKAIVLAIKLYLVKDDSPVMLWEVLTHFSRGSIEDVVGT